jgi:hypothetical protein
MQLSPKSIWSFLDQIFKAAIGGIVAGSILLYYLRPTIESPKLNVLGVLPVALAEEGNLPDGNRMPAHGLGLILKIENNSPTPAIVAISVIRGCVLMDPFAVELSLPEKERLISGREKNVYFEKYRYTTQRIHFSGSIRKDTQVIPGYGVSYVGAFFPFSAQEIYVGLPGSISLTGNCHEIKVANTEPSLFQIFNQWSAHSKLPDGLRLELTDGRLKLGMFAGNQWIYVHPRKIKTLQHARTEDWPRLELAQMYENPTKLANPTRPISAVIDGRNPVAQGTELLQPRP